jgi:hypothetical protein
MAIRLGARRGFFNLILVLALFALAPAVVAQERVGAAGAVNPEANSTSQGAPVW